MEFGEKENESACQRGVQIREDLMKEEGMGFEEFGSFK